MFIGQIRVSWTYGHFPKKNKKILKIPLQPTSSPAFPYGG
jgi:hypothetical protein